MIKILIGIAAFALATTGQVSLAGTSQVSYSSDSNYTTLAHHKNSKKFDNCRSGHRHIKDTNAVGETINVRRVGRR